MSSSDMDNSTIYEIFRACRLCGAGGGYKMPIIQDVVGVDVNDVELKQKIRDCVQIEVSQDDKMPPLICELCVDKVNDFYEFLEMCRQTNNKTRLRLGLPLQAVQETSDPGDCILGITETVYGEDDDARSKPKPKSLKHKSEQKNHSSAKEEKSPKETYKIKEVKTLKKEIKSLIQIGSSRTSRESRRKESTSPSVSSRTFRCRPSPPPVRETRQSAGESDGLSLSSLSRQLRNEQKKTEKAKDITPKSILKKETRTTLNDDDESVLVTRAKRTRERELSNPDVANKKLKITIKLPPSSKVEQDTKVEKVIKVEKDVKLDKGKVKDYTCKICGRQTSAAHTLTNHLKFRHTVTFTSPSEACNACGDWFENEELTDLHHKRYHRSRPYSCRWCKGQFKLQMTYNNHFEKNNCVPHPYVACFECKKCFKKFPSSKMRSQHSCPTKSGAACGKCGRSYTLKKNLKRHEHSCTGNQRSILDEVRISPSVRARLRPAQVRLARCDDLLKKERKCRASKVPFEHGLDPNTVYPYITSRVRIKSEPFVIDGMVSIKQEIKDEFYTEEDYVHWDSDLSSEDEDLCTDSMKESKKRVDRLSTLSLKTIFSRRCLGKVPRKLRKLKNDKFDLFNEFDISSDINNIINNLGDDDKDGVDYDSDSLLDNKHDKNEVKNNDFDAIFGNDINKFNNSTRNDVNPKNDSEINSQIQSTVNDTEVNDKNKDSVSMGSETDASIDEHVNIDRNEKVTVEMENTGNNEPMDASNHGDNLEENEKNRNGDVENNENDNYVSINKTDVKNMSDSEKCTTEKFNGEKEKSEKKLSEIDTMSLMDELDAQITGGYRGDDNGDGERKSLENISDEEFNFDA